MFDHLGNAWWVKFYRCQFCVAWFVRFDVEWLETSGIWPEHPITACWSLHRPPSRASRCPIWTPKTCWWNLKHVSCLKKKKKKHTQFFPIPSFFLTLCSWTFCTQRPNSGDFHFVFLSFFLELRPAQKNWLPCFIIFHNVFHNLLVFLCTISCFILAFKGFLCSDFISATLHPPPGNLTPAMGISTILAGTLTLLCRQRLLPVVVLPEWLGGWNKGWKDQMKTYENIENPTYENDTFVIAKGKKDETKSM